MNTKSCQESYSILRSSIKPMFKSYNWKDKNKLSFRTDCTEENSKRFKTSGNKKQLSKINS